MYLFKKRKAYLKPLCIMYYKGIVNYVCCNALRIFRNNS